MSRDPDQLIFYTQARVIVRATDAVLIATAKKKAPDPAIFEEYPPFVWANEISSDRLDAYYTVMDPETTLVNYAADAAAGVAVLIGHNTREMPVGYSLTGILDQDGAVTRVLSDAYALMDEATTPVLNRLRAGIIRDDSVGFLAKGAKCICSICGLDMWRSWDCWHIPGVEYEQDTKPTKGGSSAKVMQLCTGLIVDAHLSEYSLVYDGATPGAAVLQAQRCAEAGKLSIGQARLLEQRYRVRLPDKHTMVKGAAMAGNTNGRHDDQETPLDLRTIQQILERASAPADLLIPQGVQWLADEVARLAPLAKDGEQYRTDLIEAGVGEAVRAFGAEAGEKKRAMLATASLDTIKEFTSSWRDIGDSKLPGGRTTTDEPLADPPQMEWKPVHLGGMAKA
jgi:hypothetical protein